MVTWRNFFLAAAAAAAGATIALAILSIRDIAIFGGLVLPPLPLIGSGIAITVLMGFGAYKSA